VPKRYSFSWQESEPVSFQVDGVEYSDLNQVPDPNDRAQLRRRMARPAEARPDSDFDASFDQEVEAEFRELDRDAARFPRIIVGIFLTLSILLLATSLFTAVRTWKAVSRELSVDGRVVDIVAKPDQNAQTFNFPVVTFQLPDGNREQVQLSEGSSTPQHSVGEVVTIRYDAERPTGSARIQSSAGTALKWVMPAITAVTGTALLAAAAFALSMFKSQREASVAGQ
jgi:hypothetical protein